MGKRVLTRLKGCPCRSDHVAIIKTQGTTHRGGHVKLCREMCRKPRPEVIVNVTQKVEEQAVMLTLRRRTALDKQSIPAFIVHRHISINCIEVGYLLVHTHRFTSDRGLDTIIRPFKTKSQYKTKTY